MMRHPPSATRTYTLFPYSTRFRSRGQFARDRQRCLGTPAGAVKCLFQIDFGAGALETGDTPLADFGDDLIPRPAGSQIFRPDIDIIFVEGVDRPFRPTRVLAKRDRKSTRLNSSH